MCTVCGCSEGEARIGGQPLVGTDAPHRHDHAHDHDEHGHAHDHTPASAHHHYGTGPARAHAPGLSQSRMVQIEQDILSKNDGYARDNRRLFQQRGVLALNLVSSPGSGKTTLLTRTLTDLRDGLDLAVIEGDQETSLDAERIRATGVASVQINTGKGCHLDAHMVGHAATDLDLRQGAVLFIENVGNLVCPAAFDLGEAYKIVILSVTEGEDKPLKYPDMFHAADLMLINKIDLLPHLDFDVGRCIDAAHCINPGLQILQVSARSGAGLDAWYDWLRLQRAARLLGRVVPATV
jgi:hydrogenase nickel incorporation protein HypB